MGDRYKSPSMDWSSAGDVHKRFQLFKQKCDLIFAGPLADKQEEYKVRMLLLWVGDKGLEVYNTSQWAEDGDNLRLDPVWQRLEAYVRPRSNQILARFQLRCLKQGDMALEEFITRARTLIDDGGYDEAAKEETLRDTLVFGVKSDKARRDAIAIGNALTYTQIYDLAKTEESTEAQMDVIAKGVQSAEVHAIKVRGQVQRGKFARVKRPQGGQQRARPATQESSDTQRCKNCTGNHKGGACPAKDTKCYYCGRVGHYKRACMKKQRQVHEVAASDEDSYAAEEDYALGSIETKHLHNVTSKNTKATRGINKVFANVKLNDSYATKLKVDTGSDTCTITTDELQRSGLRVAVKPSNCILRKYGGGVIEHDGSTTLKITFRDKSTTADFKVVKAPGNPSILGCRQALELGIIALNVDAVNTQKPAGGGTTALTRSGVLQEYKDCFDKIGRFPGEKYKIQLKEDAIPVVHPPRTVPVHVLPLYKAELDKMLADGIISPVTGPTDWVNSIVCNITEGKNGKKVRLCLDPKDLNRNIRREHYYSRTIDELLPGLHNKKYFSVVDTKKGYWHVELDDESRQLTAFNTPFGRYMFNRLPFGLMMSQDVFQPRLDAAYQGIANVTGIADDIIVAGSTIEEHDRALVEMLEASRKANIGLNSEKFQFRQSKVRFYGHVITDKGLEPCSDKLEAIKNLKAPESVKELATILGMVTYLNRFSTRLAPLTAPLRELNKKGVHFTWEAHHQKALEKVKEELCQTTALWYYDPDPATRTILQCDASQLGLGAWLRQEDKNGNERIVAMTSRTLTDAETRYSNIERECLAVQYGLEKFEYYLMGRHTVVESDHSPLEQIFKKNISDAPTRLQRMLLRCLKYDVEVVYKPGIKVPVADALSRVCVKKTDRVQQVHEVSFVAGIKCPIDVKRIKSVCEQDTTHHTLRNMVYRGWPEYRKQCPAELWDYWNFRCDLVIDDGLVLKGDRIVIPDTLREEVLRAIHTGHQGETKCILLARESVFWPGVGKDIQKMIQECPVCTKYQAAQPRLPLMQPDLPTKAWSKLGTDIFEYNDSKYLIVVDYYSRYIIVRKLVDMRAETICEHFTQILMEFGLPSTIVADCGTQYMSEAFRKKCRDSNIEVVYSAPHHHQANSVAERAVGTVKHLWRKAAADGQDRATALWMYRITPLDDHLPSPHELLFGKKPKTFLPNQERGRIGDHDRDSHITQNQHRQDNQRRYYKAGSDRRRLHVNESVDVYNTIRKIWEPAVVIRQDNPVREPRTYVVSKNGRELHRTREHIRPRKAPMPAVVPESTTVPMTATTPPDEDQPVDSVPRASTPANSTAHKPDKNTRSDEQCAKPVAKPVLRSQTTRSGRVTSVPQKYMN